MHIVQPGTEIDVLKENNKIAHENYRLMKQHNIKSIDFMGSIGAGKTSLIIKLAEKLRASASAPSPATSPGTTTTPGSRSPVWSP